MTEQMSPREDWPPASHLERDITQIDTSRSRLCDEADEAEGVPTVEVYEEGLEWYFELSSWLASHRVDGAGRDEEYEAIEAKLVALDRELSELSRDLSLSEIGRLLRD